MSAKAGSDNAIFSNFSAPERDTDEVKKVARWSIPRAIEWYSKLPEWIIGCNFIPSTAVNQIEMWHKDTYDPVTIERELAMAEKLGFNTLRVYLHDLVWSNDRIGFEKRIDHFLGLASSHNMYVILVLFDDCHRPDPYYGAQQPAPIPRVHNSGWKHSPGQKIVMQFHENTVSPREKQRLKDYVTEVITRFSKDRRVLMWDIYNEPGQSNNGSKSYNLLKLTWEWAQSVRPSQPLTSCLDGSISSPNWELNAEKSDIITFHLYQGATLEKTILRHKKNFLGRPIICTEYMAREFGTTFKYSLPIFKRHEIGCISWGLVAGKSQTHFNWETVNRLDFLKTQGIKLRDGDPIPEPEKWFHDIFRTDGTAYDPSEVTFIRNMVGKRNLPLFAPSAVTSSSSIVPSSDSQSNLQISGPDLLSAKKIVILDKEKERNGLHLSPPAAQSDGISGIISGSIKHFRDSNNLFALENISSLPNDHILHPTSHDLKRKGVFSEYSAGESAVADVVDGDADEAEAAARAGELGRTILNMLRAPNPSSAAGTVPDLTSSTSSIVPIKSKRFDRERGEGLQASHPPLQVALVPPEEKDLRGIFDLQQQLRQIQQDVLLDRLPADIFPGEGPTAEMVSSIVHRQLWETLRQQLRLSGRYRKDLIVQLSKLFSTACLTNVRRWAEEELKEAIKQSIAPAVEALRPDLQQRMQLALAGLQSTITADGGLMTQQQLQLQSLREDNCRAAQSRESLKEEIDDIRLSLLRIERSMQAVLNRSSRGADAVAAASIG